VIFIANKTPRGGYKQHEGGNSGCHRENRRRGKAKPELGRLEHGPTLPVGLAALEATELAAALGRCGRRGGRGSCRCSSGSGSGSLTSSSSRSTGSTSGAGTGSTSTSTTENLRELSWGLAIVSDSELNKTY
jgi:hypothetical protein